MINPINGLRVAPDTEVKRNINQSDRKSEDVSLKKALDHLIKAVKTLNNKIRFEYDEDMEKMVVKVIDGNSGKLIRQIPHEDIVNLSKNTDKLDGLLIDKEI